jgi:hypothetical protein
VKEGLEGQVLYCTVRYHGDWSCIVSLGFWRIIWSGFETLLTKLQSNFAAHEYLVQTHETILPATAQDQHLKHISSLIEDYYRTPQFSSEEDLGD